MSIVSMDDQEVLYKILFNSEALLLDFDGPVCDLFAGVGAAKIAERLRGVLAESGHLALPAEVAGSADPFAIFEHAATLGEREAGLVESALADREAEAVPNAVETPGARELLAAWQFAGRPLAIVSNNSAAAIETYLDRRELKPFVTVVSARQHADPAALKPSPRLLAEAAKSVSISLSHCTMIGDSTADVVAGIRAASSTIGYATDQDAAAELALSYPDAITTSISGMVPAVKRIANRKHSS